VRIFDGFLDVEEADRLSPFKSETPKSRENSRFWASSDYTRHPKEKHLFSGRKRIFPVDNSMKGSDKNG
jgi:hypothetical protein